MKKRAFTVTEYSLTAHCSPSGAHCEARHAESLRCARAGGAEPICAALISDTHGRIIDDLAEAAAEAAPDLILVPGDAIENKRPGHPDGIRMLARLAAVAPVFFSVGNHERALSREPDRRSCRGGDTLRRPVDRALFGARHTAMHRRSSVRLIRERRALRDIACRAAIYTARPRGAAAENGGLYRRVFGRGRCKAAALSPSRILSPLPARLRHRHNLCGACARRTDTAVRTRSLRPRSGLLSSLYLRRTRRQIRHIARTDKSLLSPAYI